METVIGYAKTLLDYDWSTFRCSYTLKINKLKQTILLFIVWTTIILVQLTELWFRCNNDWVRWTNESIGSTMKLVMKYQIICWFDQKNGCPHYEQRNWLFWPISFKSVWDHPDELTMQWLQWAHCELVSCEFTVLAQCDLTVYLTVRYSGELTVSMVLAYTFTGVQSH